MKAPEAKFIIALVVTSLVLLEITGSNELSMLTNDSTVSSSRVSGESPNAATKDSTMYSDIKIFFSISSERSIPFVDAFSYLSEIF